jgi:ornithine cyclodeaminase
MKPRCSTLFLGASDVVAIVRTHGLPQVLDRLAGRIEADFRRWPQFDKSARLASHSPVGVIELMPASDARHYAFKYVNGHPANPGLGLGLPTVMAFGVLADVATGEPRLVSDLTLVTALRTAATSVVAARALARRDSRTMALVGNGAQGEFQALAFHHLMGVRELRLFDVDAAAMARVQGRLLASGLQAVACASLEEAVRGASIVTTATADKTRAALITPRMLEPGMHLNAIGGDCPGKTELDPGVVQAARVFVEYEPQTRVEGDLQQMPADFQVTELWRVLVGEAPGRQDASDVTVFDSVGFALEDFSALAWLREAALGLGLGRYLDLVPNLADPKDLYGALGACGTRAEPGLQLPA